MLQYSSIISSTSSRTRPTATTTIWLFLLPDIWRWGGATDLAHDWAEEQKKTARGYDTDRRTYRQTIAKRSQRCLGLYCTRTCHWPMRMKTAPLKQCSALRQKKTKSLDCALFKHNELRYTSQYYSVFHTCRHRQPLERVLLHMATREGEKIWWWWWWWSHSMRIKSSSDEGRSSHGWITRC